MATSSAASGTIPEQAIPQDVRDEVTALVTNNRNRPDVIAGYISTTVTNSMTADHVHHFNAFCHTLFDSSVPLPLARSLYKHIVSSLLALENDDQFMQLADFYMAVHIVPSNNSRACALEYFLVPMRIRMSNIYEQRSDHHRAASILATTPIETITELDNNAGNKNNTPKSTTTNGGLNDYNIIMSGAFAIYVRIAQLFVLADTVDRAEYYHSRATAYMNSFKGDDSVRLQHRICHARILDLKCKFEDAAHKYYILANDPQSDAHLADAMSDTDSPALIYAVTCAVLAPAGPRRSRLLAMLYNDERSKSLDIYPLLESIHMGRLLRKDQVDGLRSILLAHQKTPHPEGDTVLDHAAIEHNMLAISRMYTNIGLNRLGALLNVSPEKAEKIARVMINEQRMTASIDQVDQMVQFSDQNPSENIEQWDALIASLCGQVDDCVDAIVQKFPQYATHV